MNSQRVVHRKTKQPGLKSIVKPKERKSGVKKIVYIDGVRTPISKNRNLEATQLKACLESSTLFIYISSAAIIIITPFMLFFNVQMVST